MTLLLTGRGYRPPVAFPDDAVVGKIGILASPGAGKSNLAVVLAEEMFKANLPWVAIDPKGDWYGIRSNRDGAGPGLAVPVLGGLHGDVPLEATAGKVVANLIVERNLTCVVDVSEFDTRQEMWRFLYDFAGELLRRNRTPRHVFAEEAADYLPQTQTESGYLPRCRSAWRRLVSHGRQRGIGITLISQRSAKLDKEALDLIDTLIAMRATSPRDLAAIKGWVHAHDLGPELVESLPALDDGEGWVWSPHALKVMERARFRRRATFDSGATPLLDVGATAPATLADVDLDALKDQMAATIEKANADDPRVLRARVVELEAELRRERAARPEPVETVVEVPVFPPEVRAGVEAAAESIRQVVFAHHETIRCALAALPNDLTEPYRQLLAALDATPTPPATRAARPTAPPAPPRAHRAPAVDGPTPALGKRERAILTVLAVHGPRTQRQLALQTGYSAKASTIPAGATELRKAGLIEQGQPFRITDAGRAAVAALVDVDPLPEGPALLAYWRDELGGRERAILDLIVAAYPNATTKDDVAAATGYSPAASTIPAGMTTLRKLGIVERGAYRLTDDFANAIR